MVGRARHRLLLRPLVGRRIVCVVGPAGLAVVPAADHVHLAVAGDAIEFFIRFWKRSPLLPGRRGHLSEHGRGEKQAGRDQGQSRLTARNALGHLVFQRSGFHFAPVLLLAPAALGRRIRIELQVQDVVHRRIGLELGIKERQRPSGLQHPADKVKFDCRSLRPQPRGEASASRAASSRNWSPDQTLPLHETRRSAPWSLPRRPRNRFCGRRSPSPRRFEPSASAGADHSTCRHWVVLLYGVRVRRRQDVSATGAAADDVDLAVDRRRRTRDCAAPTSACGVPTCSWPGRTHRSY